MAARRNAPMARTATRRYIGQALKALIMHEVGHTLGLRHNFRGSAGVTKAQLADRTFTKAHGLGVSVMDYSPPALSLDPAKQGDYHAGTIGTYDRWAIRYGYARWARASWRRPTERAPPRWPRSGRRTRDQCAPDRGEGSGRPAHLYGTDEDAGFGGLGLDPTVSATTRPTIRWSGPATGSP